MKLARHKDLNFFGLILLALISFSEPTFAGPTLPGPVIESCPVLPADNVWNTKITQLPVHPRSSAWINTIGPLTGLKADFGSGLWEGGPIGIPINMVSGTQPRVNVTFEYADESDRGPYPIPPNAQIEGGPNSTGDRHILLVDRDNCVLYETFSTYRNSDGSWRAGSGAIFDLNSNMLRTDGWTSADAAGLPILPGLVRYEEVLAGEIRHAIRFTVPKTQRAYLWPARHFASSITDPNYPPMGARFRLRADFDISTFAPEVRVILQAMKTYGIILADNGSAWYISGAPDERWNNDILRQLNSVKGSAFEAVDASSLMIHPDSGQARQPSTGPTPSPTPSPTSIPTPTATPVPTPNPTPEPAVTVQSVELNPASVIGGSNSLGTVTLSSAAPVGGVQILIQENSSYASAPSSVTVPAGASSASFEVKTIRTTRTRSVTITVSMGGVAKSAVLTIRRR